jgi:hypothetical protein
MRLTALILLVATVFLQAQTKTVMHTGLKA